MESPAFYGVAGDLVRVIEPHSEADPVALLVQTLVFFGSAIGRGPGFRAEGDFHATNEYVAIVGRTSKGRKGTSIGRIKEAFALVDDRWLTSRLASGLVSGEGLIWQVRDPITKRRKAKPGEAADDEGFVDEIEDHGVEDKRLLVFEGELAQPLRSMQRAGSTLSIAIRNMWDSGSVESMTKNNPSRTTGAHTSIIGHISQDELRRELTATDAASGFANRFLFICAERSKQLPDGGEVPQDDLRQVTRVIRGAVEQARRYRELRRDGEARELWHAEYGELSEGRPGMLGAITGRAEAHVMRLATLYALLDGRGEIAVAHLQAALSLWEYAAQSAAYIFGGGVGDPVADEILDALERAENGLTRSRIGDLFQRHQSSERIGAALRALEEAGLVYSLMQPSDGGRSRELWCAKSDLSAVSPNGRPAAGKWAA